MLKTQENIDLYKLVLQAYNTFDLTAKLVNDNGLDPNVELGSGQEVYADPALYVKDQVAIKIQQTIPATSFTITSTEQQSWVDVMLMGYSGFDNAAKWVSDNDLVTVNRGSTDRKTFTFDNKLVSNPILVSDYLSRGVVYSTGFVDVVIIPDEGGCYILREDGSYMLREDGSRIRREICIGGYILREDGTYLLREDGKKFIRE